MIGHGTEERQVDRVVHELELRAANRDAVTAGYDSEGGRTILVDMNCNGGKTILVEMNCNGGKTWQWFVAQNVRSSHETLHAPVVELLDVD